MDIDLDKIPEYEIFKDLTTLDEMFGRVVIDPSIKPRFFEEKESGIDRRTSGQANGGDADTGATV